MLLSYIYFVWFISCVAAQNPLSDAFIKLLTGLKLTWKAGRNFPANSSYNVVKALAGANSDDRVFEIIPKISYTLEAGKTLPKSFDCRSRWAKCKSINDIKEQGACGSSWAVAAAATMTDRLCILSKGTDTFTYSSEDLHSCCIGHSCTKGGFISLAWQYWQLYGLVSGGKYGSTKNCRPFSLPPCDFYKGCTKIASVPPCNHECKSGFHTTYRKNKRRGERIYTITGGETQIQLEIYKNGPVEALMNVFSDFLSYKTGVYRHVRGELINAHAVKIIGWGVESGTKFWTVVNSWGTRWGNRGFFKIVRGENHCGVEQRVIAGIPQLRTTKTRQRIQLNFYDKMKLELDW